MSIREQQARDFIAETFYSYVNGIEDCGTTDYPLLTKEQYKDYIWQTLEYEKDLIVNGVERKHIYFVGKERFNELVNEFLNNEENKEYIKGE